MGEVEKTSKELELEKRVAELETEKKSLRDELERSNSQHKIIIDVQLGNTGLSTENKKISGNVEQLKEVVADILDVMNVNCRDWDPPMKEKLYLARKKLLEIQS